MVSPALAALGVPHAFTTRLLGGARDDLSHVRALGLPLGRLLRVRQVHGGTVHRASPPGEEPAELTAADALLSEHPGDVPAVVTADCVPVLLAGADGRGVAAVHAGWRGLLAGVIPATVAALGGARAAAVGPCLSQQRFEVGPEVAAAFLAAGYGRHVRAGNGDRSHVDLRGVAADQLCAGGVGQVDSTDLCTYDRSELFCSHRRDVTHGGAERTGRQLALIAAAG